MTKDEFDTAFLEYTKKSNKRAVSGTGTLDFKSKLGAYIKTKALELVPGVSVKQKAMWIDARVLIPGASLRTIESWFKGSSLKTEVLEKIANLLSLDIAVHDTKGNFFIPHTGSNGVTKTGTPFDLGQYLCVPVVRPPFYSDWFTLENHWSDEIQIVLDLVNKVQTTDGKVWTPIKVDHL